MRRRGRHLVIWGANTGVGKTLVSAGLVRAALGKGSSALFLKPVQTGVPDSDGSTVAAVAGGIPHLVGTHAAAAALYERPARSQASTSASSRAVTLFAWRQPASPHVAVAGEGRPVSDEELVRATQAELDRYASQGGELAFVETAGGVASPAPSGRLQCEALRPLELPGLLVGDGRLGGISSTICAAEALAARGHAVNAVVLLSEQDGAGYGNADRLREYFAGVAGAPPVFDLPLPPSARLGHGQQWPEAEAAAEAGAEKGTEAGADAGALSQSELTLRRWIDSCSGTLAEVLDAATSSGPAASATAVADGGVTFEGDLLLEDKRLLWHPYTSTTRPSPCQPVVSASGVRLKLRDGSELIDGMSSWWAAVHGYAVPQLDSAASGQIGRMPHVMFGGLTHAPAVGLAQRLVSVTPPPLQRVFLCDSGSVAVEVAIKMALQFFRARGVEGRHRLLTVRGGYHGDTFGAMAVCDPVNGMHAEMFSGVLPSHCFAPRPSPAFDEPFDESHTAELGRLFAEHGDEVAALILEPIVQGAGGMRFYSPGYLRAARRLCDSHGALLILDCIATGFGRTGRLFACEHAGVSPDIMCVGKALTGGYMTMGATLATQEVADGASGGRDAAAPIPLMHGPTFMANPLACAVASASIDLLLASPWQRRVQAISEQLATELEPLRHSPAVADVRTLGAIGVVELAAPADVPSTQATLAAHGVWLRPFGKLLYTMPPFVIGEADLAKVTSGIRAVVESIERQEVPGTPMHFVSPGHSLAEAA